MRTKGPSLALLGALGFLGSLLSAGADVICVRAVKASGTPVGLLALSGLMLAAGAPIWYAMSRISGGDYVRPAIAWTISASLFSIIAVTLCDGQQSPRQWIGFALILIGAFVRG